MVAYACLMSTLKKILVTGGAGYCGSRLVPQLLETGYEVTVYDTMYFTEKFLPTKNPRLNLVRGDIRDVEKFSTTVKGHDAVVNLACISNDASFELDEELSTSINLNAFEPMVVASKAAGVKRFIYASSSSVYGISDKPDVTEDHPLVPLTLYNKYKGECEPLLIKHTDKNFVGVIFRPATICGYAPRQRLDLSVNILTNLAVNKGEITVFGGTQIRPNLHVQDYCDVVKLLLEAQSDLVQNQIFNVGSQNLKISEIALIVKQIVELRFPDKGEIKILTTSTDDNRSYHINSDKIKRELGFIPKYTISDAIIELCDAFAAKKLPNSLSDDIYFNVKRLKKLGIE
jgi:nucleoside-diphosphate-sugar epimerase